MIHSLAVLGWNTTSYNCCPVITDKSWLTHESGRTSAGTFHNWHPWNMIDWLIFLFYNRKYCICNDRSFSCRSCTFSQIQDGWPSVHHRFCRTLLGRSLFAHVAPPKIKTRCGIRNLGKFGVDALLLAGGLRGQPFCLTPLYTYSFNASCDELYLTVWGHDHYKL